MRKGNGVDEKNKVSSYESQINSGQIGKPHKQIVNKQVGARVDSMTDKILFKAGIMLEVLGVALVVLGVTIVCCTFPTLSYTREETHTQPAVQHSEIIMDYSINLETTFVVRQVPFQCGPNQTLNILLRSNGGKRFQFSIRSLLSSGEAIYLDPGSGSLIQTSWKPNSNGDYYLRFQATDYPVSVNCNVTKTWTVPASNYTVPVTEQKSILDPSYHNLGLGTTVVGSWVIVVGASILYKQRKPKA